MNDTVKTRTIFLANKFGIGRVVGLILLALFVTLRVWDPGPLEVLRLKTFDFYQVIKPRAQKQVPVAIIDIDEESLNAIGQWPWPRTTLAQLVNQVSTLGGAVIGFDVIFAESDRLSPGALAAHYPSLDPVTQRRIAKLPSNDLIFSHAIKRFRTVVGLSGYHRALEHASRTPIPAPPLGTLGGDPKPMLLGYPGAVRNIQEIESVAAGHGVITIKPESDGIVRRVPAILNVQGTILPNLTIEMLRVATGGGPLVVKRDELGLTSIVVGGVEIPTDEHGQFWIHFAPHDRARYLSAKDVLNGSVDPALIANHLLVVGTSAVGLHDIKATPIDPVMPGVEIHAQVLETILSQSYLSRPAYAVGAEIVLAIAVGLLIITILPIFRAWVVLVFGATVAVTLAEVSWGFYSNKGLLIDVAYPMGSSFVIYCAMVFVNYLRAERQRRQIRLAFSQYVSPTMVAQLTQHPENLVLGGMSRETTVLFSDVRGFTAISELYKDDPQGLTTLMNRFLTPLSNAIIERMGTIDKYMGDSIMAFWNAPLDDTSHALHACDASLEMHRRLSDLNVVLEKEAESQNRRFIPLHAGIGINTGRCVVGNLGSDLRFDYSVLGDSVNLASRLEGQSKTYGVPIVIGSSTANLIQHKFALIELDFIRVKGKLEPEVVHTILGGEDVLKERDYQQLAVGMSELFTLYRNQQWEKAQQVLEECRKIGNGYKLDETFELYDQRIRAFLTTPPPEDWDGVFVATTK